MRSARAEKLSRRYLLEDLPAFVARKTLVYEPSEWLLRGFTYESSGHTGNDFYFWVFVQPLYVPKDHLILSFGDRLGGSSRFWSLDEGSEEVVMSQVLDIATSEGLPFLDDVRQPEDLMGLVERRLHVDDPNRHEIVAYSMIIDGDPARAKAILDRAANGAEPDEPGWMGEVRSRARTVRELLERGRGDALGQLRAWRDQTAAALGID